MRKNKSKLRVFKLRSGEEIIAKIAARPRGKFTLERPMKINYSVVADPFTGLKRVCYISQIGLVVLWNLRWIFHESLFFWN